ncbi:hypothetical protein QVD17_37955 [Tagetes erecta]|uniref:PB1-like domain-containing protein n=1 Tax=Tagetes erecta TaxID=13708 RepID=A0AAD8NKA2_TARER|nr:hypothetical protein QVD17_37955 [Tagetes erecta]
MDQSDVDKLYVGYPNMFSIKLHHGGSLTPFPGSTYNGGKVSFIDLVDIEKFSVHELDGIMGELDYPLDEQPIYYHFLVPGETQLDFGLRALGNDKDVLNLSKYVSENKVIDVYTEIRRTNLHTYFCSPGKVTIEEIIDEGLTDVEVTRNTSKRLQLDWLEPTIKQGCIGQSSVKDHDMANINYDDLFSYDNLQVDIVEAGSIHGNSIMMASGNIQGNTMGASAFMDNTMGDMRRFSGEEDSGEEGSDEEDNDEEDKDEEGSDSDDSDFIVDEENKMREFDVDMMDYKMNVDLDVDDTLEDENIEDDLETINNDVFIVVMKRMKMLQVFEGKS